MNIADVLKTYTPTTLESATDAELFVAAELAAVDAGKYHPAVRPVCYVAPDADPSTAQYDRAIASLTPAAPDKPTVH